MSETGEHVLKRIITSARLYAPLRAWRVKRGQKRALADWERAGRPAPPPHLAKQRTLTEYAREQGLRILVETGTYYGDMVEAMRHDFDRVYSIELSAELFERAKRRFKKARNVELVRGDSGIELGAIVQRLEQPALFWLDGHYSGGETAKGRDETPIYAELEHVLTGSDSGHVVIIDDARLFGTDPAYPTIEELRAFVSAMRPDHHIEVLDDSIRITPGEPPSK